jgi:hypothetical protein
MADKEEGKDKSNRKNCHHQHETYKNFPTASFFRTVASG